jgi:molecular chaperone DnaK (HSP70)
VDFDNAIYEELCARLYQAYQFRPVTALQKERLKTIARTVKLELCTPGVEEIPVKYDVLVDGEEQSLETGLTRQRFEEISSPLLLKTLEKTAAMLDAAEKKILPVARIILTGGASQMPMVRRSLQELIGDRFSVEEPYQPSRAVSFGAALYGAFHQLRQRTQHTYGVMVRSGKKSTGFRLHPMIEPGVELPARSPEPLVIKAPPSGTLLLRAAYSDDGKKPAERMQYFNLDGLPVAGTLEVTLSVDESLNLSLVCKAPDGRTFSDSTARR